MSPRTFRPLALVLLLLAAPALCAKERWLTLRSGELHFIGNASPSQASDAAHDFVRLRAAIAQVTARNVRAPLPMKVFILDERSFVRYARNVLQRESIDVAAAFSHTGAGDFVLLRADMKRPSARASAADHELTHYLLANSTTGLPLWLREGLAEYFSTFSTDGPTTILGTPPIKHVPWLRRHELIPLAALFTMTAAGSGSDDDLREGVLYAQSWALVHMLMQGDRERLMRIIGGQPFDVAALEKDLRAYVPRIRFDITRTTLTPDLPKAEPMPRDAVLYELGHLLAHTDPKNAAEATKLLHEALTLNPRHAAAHADLGILGSEVSLAKAAELGRDDPEVLWLVADTLFRRAANNPAADMLPMRALFTCATELDPRNARAWAGLGATYIYTSGDVTPGIAALEKSLALTPGDEGTMFHLVQLYSHAARTADARRLISTLSASSNETIRAQARQTLHELERVTAGNRVVDQMNAAVAAANADDLEGAIAILDELLPTIDDPEMKEQARKFREELAGRIE
jgi:Flp pilus assembly protein TadD